MSLRTGFDPVLALTCATETKTGCEGWENRGEQHALGKGMATKGRGKTDAIVTEAEKGIGVPPGGPVLFVR